jgi:hypothetical protein
MMRRADPFSETHEERVSPFRKKEARGEVSNMIKKTAVFMILQFSKPHYSSDPNTLKYSILYYF